MPGLPLCDCGCCSRGCHHCDTDCTSRLAEIAVDGGYEDYLLARAPHTRTAIVTTLPTPARRRPAA